jgi:hypothetical protein
VSNKKVFYTFSLYPEIFSSEYLQSSMIIPARLQDILKFIINKGIIHQVSNLWLQEINKYLEQYIDIEFKLDIQKLLEILDKKNKIHYCNLLDDISFERWVEYIKQFSLDYYIAHNSQDIVKNIENIDLQNDYGNITSKQTKEFIEKNFRSIIPYANYIKLIDPYFTLMEPRHIELIEIICEFLGTKCNSKNCSKTIEIHTSNKINDVFTNEDWLNKIIELQKKFCHKIVVFIWKNIPEEKMHDRYLLTDVGSFSIGKGLDVDNRVESTWGYLSKDSEENIFRKFEKNNSNGFKLVKEIKTDDILKKQKYSLNYIANELNTDIENILQIIEDKKIPLLPILSIERKYEQILSKRQKEKIIKAFKG